MAEGLHSRLLYRVCTGGGGGCVIQFRRELSVPSGAQHSSPGPPRLGTQPHLGWSSQKAGRVPSSEPARSV